MGRTLRIFAHKGVVHVVDVFLSTTNQLPYILSMPEGKVRDRGTNVHGAREPKEHLTGCVPRQTLFGKLLVIQRKVVVQNQELYL